MLSHRWLLRRSLTLAHTPASVSTLNASRYLTATPPTFQTHAHTYATSNSTQTQQTTISSTTSDTPSVDHISYALPTPPTLTAVHRASKDAPNPPSNQMIPRQQSLPPRPTRLPSLHHQPASPLASSHSDAIEGSLPTGRRRRRARFAFPPPKRQLRDLEAEIAQIRSKEKDPRHLPFRPSSLSRRLTANPIRFEALLSKRCPIPPYEHRRREHRHKTYHSLVQKNLQRSINAWKPQTMFDFTGLEGEDEDDSLSKDWSDPSTPETEFDKTPTMSRSPASLDLTREQMSVLVHDYTESTLAHAAEKAGRRPIEMLTHNPIPGAVDPRAFAEQICSEREAVSATAEYYAQGLETMKKLRREHTLSAGQRIILEWFGPLVPAMQALQNESRHFQKDGIGPYLSLLSASEIAVITIHTLFGLVLHEPEGTKFAACAISVGKAIEGEAKLAWQRQSVKQARQEYQVARQQSTAGVVQKGPPLTDKSTTEEEFHLGISPNSTTFQRRTKRIKTEPWSAEIHVKIGSALMAVFMGTCGLPREMIHQKARRGTTNSFDGSRAHFSLNASAATATRDPNELMSNNDSSEDLSENLATDNLDGVWTHSDARDDESLERRLEASLIETTDDILPPSVEAIEAQFEKRMTGHTKGEVQTHTKNGKANASKGKSKSAAVDSASTKSKATPNSSKAKPDQSLDFLPIASTSPDFVPAVFHFFKTVRSIVGARITGFVRADVRLVNLFSKDTEALKSLLPKFNPMVIPPRKWTAADVGGYLTVKHRVIRTLQGSNIQMDMIKQANLRRIFEGVNYLASTPWKINEPVWNVLQQLWERGGGVADLPAAHDWPIPYIPPGDRSPRARWAHSLKQKNANLFSQRCELRYRFAAAQELVGRKIYYPYFLDFRGRAYPIPPYLNHTGSDVSRGLLTFHDGKPLGKRGLYWLLVHAATLYGGGVDKESYENRRKWTESNLTNIHYAVHNPLESQWWLKADKPFQFLAAAFEVFNAMRLADPSKYVSNLPVHTDGSCNGLQHYAALGRDLWGGTCVNLVASDKPQDVYARVLDTVVVKLKADAEDSKSSYQAVAQKLLTLHLTRKIVKQAVMTSVYGVTLIGARDQILARLVEMPEAVALFPDSGATSLSMVALYLAQLTLNSLYDAFAGARRIQNWLGECANRMSSVQQPVSWITPLGLPIIQPYRAVSQHTVETAMQKVSLTNQSEHLPVSSVRQKSAFPPNFIHSLDATHMLMTARQCEERGITFAAVHDSYWTHAGSMDTLSVALREQFVQLYEQPILEQTREMWVRRYPEVSFPPVPERGQLDVKEVLKSPYFFN